jgi:murein DD-endopeptidase MepM/ murein hydrolase activator NlpD
MEWLNVAEPVASDIQSQGWFQWLTSYMNTGLSLSYMPIQAGDMTIEVPTINTGSGQQGTSTATAPGATASTQGAASAKYVTPQGFPSDIDIAVVSAVLNAAKDVGIPYPLALALIQQESQFNPKAVGDDGCSVGVAQLNTCAGEGVGVPAYLLQDPYSNAKISFARVKQVMNANPGMDWGTVAAMAQRPADASGYAKSVNSYIDQIQTGQGTMGWGLSAIRTGDPTFQGNVVYGANNVPPPFSQQFFSNITQSFGQNGEEGTDFAMPVGQQISTPVGGIIHVVDDGKSNWGKAVYVKMPNGWTFFVGHLTNFAVQEGETVGPGDLLGQSGGAQNDPSSGNSTGPHIEVRFIDPGGQNQDPMQFLTPLYTGKGTTFAQWAGGIFAGSAQPSPVKQNLTETGDGQFIDLNTTEGAWWKTVDSAWTSIYGTHAPLQAAMDFRNAGINTVDALQNAMLNMPSSIPGVTIGAYQNMSKQVQSTANQAFGRAVPDSLISQFFQQGITSADDIKLWFDTHSSSDIPKADYQAIYDAALPYSQALSNDVPHPSDVSSIYQNATQSSGRAMMAP